MCLKRVPTHLNIHIHFSHAGELYIMQVVVNSVLFSYISSYCFSNVFVLFLLYNFNALSSSLSYVAVYIISTMYTML